MLDQGILKPVLPEIHSAAAGSMRLLIDSEVKAGVGPDALRRLSALLPRDPLTAEKIAARLKLSNKARKRLACAAGAETGSDPRALAYRLGTECAVDRLLLEGSPDQAASIKQWSIPKLPIGGGALISRGLREGPVVARTLKFIEDRWLAAGFPQGAELERIVEQALSEGS
jgi:poly(A) polymerase